MTSSTPKMPRRLTPVDLDLMEPVVDEARAMLTDEFRAKMRKQFAGDGRLADFERTVAGMTFLVALYDEMRFLFDANTDERRRFLRRGVERAVELLKEHSSRMHDSAVAVLERGLHEMKEFHAKLEGGGQ